MKLLTAGESHGCCLTGILEGFPAGVELSVEEVNKQLRRRQCGYGRGGRMSIETDIAKVTAGVRGGRSLGSPICVVVENKDHVNWMSSMDAWNGDNDAVRLTAVRPGHADLSGMIKYGFSDARNVLERASARETAVRVAVGGICRQALSFVGVEVESRVISVGGKCGEDEIKAEIDSAKQAGDTLGGEAVITVKGMPVGVGSYVHYDRKLDGQLAMQLMSLQSVKAVGFGLGWEYAQVRGSAAHDEILSGGRKTNNAGGIEGGMSNGEDIVIRLTFKPIPTLMKGLRTVDVDSGEQAIASSERSDVCAVEAAAVVAENITAFAVLDELLKTFGGDTITELLERVNGRRSKR